MTVAASARARLVKATWGQHCAHLVFASNQDDESIGAVAIGTQKDQYHALWAKSHNAWQYMFNNYPQCDFFMKADLDTFIHFDNLNRLVRTMQRDEPLFFGRYLKWPNDAPFMAGAAIIISNGAMQKAKNVMATEHCFSHGAGQEDFRWGMCMEEAGVQAKHIVDEQQRELFMNLNPSMVYRRAYPDWFWEGTYSLVNETALTKANIAVEPELCCSPNMIAWHYVGAREYGLDFFYNGTTRRWQYGAPIADPTLQAIVKLAVESGKKL